MIPDVVAIYGIPFDRLDVATTVERIFQLRDEALFDSSIRFVSSVSTDVMKGLLGPLPEKSNHPELYTILCSADLITAADSKLVKLSEKLGVALPEPVSGGALIPEICRVAEEKGLSIYLLGGEEKATNQVAEYLKEKFPALTIAGVDTPWIFTEGEELQSSTVDDKQTLRRIHSVSPDLLLVAFGSPKQEVWFNRNRRRLRVPVTIGIGETFDARVQPVEKQEPEEKATSWVARLFKRSGAALGGDALESSGLNSLFPDALLSGAPGENGVVEHAELDGSVLRFPQNISRETLVALEEALVRLEKEKGRLQLDFSQTIDIDLDALGALIRMGAWAHHKSLHIGMIPLPEGFAAKLKYLRGWHALRESIPMVMSDGSGDPERELSVRLGFGPNQVYVFLTGRMDTYTLKSLDVNHLLEQAHGKSMVIDATWLSFMDSSGLGVLVGLHNALKKSGQKLTMEGASGPVLQMLKVTRLDKVFALES